MSSCNTEGRHLVTNSFIPPRPKMCYFHFLCIKQCTENPADPVQTTFSREHVIPYPPQTCFRMRLKTIITNNHRPVPVLDNQDTVIKSTSASEFRYLFFVYQLLERTVPQLYTKMSECLNLMLQLITGQTTEMQSTQTSRKSKVTFYMSKCIHDLQCSTQCT